MYDLPIEVLEELLHLLINYVLLGFFIGNGSLLVIDLVIIGKMLLLWTELLEMHELSSSIIDQLT